MRFINKFINFYQHQDGIIFWSTAISTLMALLLLSLFLFNYLNLPTQIPLFFSLPWGDAQLSQKNQFILLPSIILLSLLVNLILSWHLHVSQIQIKRILSVSTVAISFLILISGLKIIHIII